MRSRIVVGFFVVCTSGPAIMAHAQDITVSAVSAAQ